MASQRVLQIRNFLIAAGLVIGLLSTMAGGYLALDRRSRANTGAIERLAEGQKRMELKLDQLIEVTGELKVKVGQLEVRVGALEQRVGKLLSDFNTDF